MATSALASTASASGTRSVGERAEPRQQLEGERLELALAHVAAQEAAHHGRELVDGEAGQHEEGVRELGP
jgi:hypothetical protein